MNRTSGCIGMTLVELLVVITIIGIWLIRLPLCAVLALAPAQSFGLGLAVGAGLVGFAQRQPCLRQQHALDGGELGAEHVLHAVALLGPRAVGGDAAEANLASGAQLLDRLVEAGKLASALKAGELSLFPIVEQVLQKNNVGIAI